MPPQPLPDGELIREVTTIEPQSPSEEEHERARPHPGSDRTAL
ncbi:hypothetical protein MINT15_29280 [Saccharomonospora viridis]|uniref:Uncharacterized protein n=1 Tax=Saccharomonospora viridis TaxID=1852 RepID=A0A837DAC0_9PSEU|nr:hypothetical protein MINT15_29280 [Saccharomonospora viridis]